MDKNFWLGNLSEWLGVIAVMMIAGVSPLVKRTRHVEFKYPKRELNFALVLFVLIYVFAFLFYTTDIFDFLKTLSANFSGGEYAEKMILAVVALLPFVIAIIARGQPFKAAGWSRENLRVGLLVGLTLGLLTIFLRGKFMTIIGGFSAKQLGLLGVLLVYSLAEETIFRGYIQLRMDSRFGQKWGWLISAALFILWQFAGRFNTLTWAAAWPVLLISLVQGLLLGFIMKKSNHVLAPALYRALSLWVMML